MGYRVYDINDIKDEKPKGIDLWFQRLLYRNFSERTAKSIYKTVILIIAFFRKVGLVLSLPIMFFRFFGQEYRKERQKSKDSKNKKD